MRFEFGEERKGGKGNKAAMAKERQSERTDDLGYENASDDNYEDNSDNAPLSEDAKSQSDAGYMSYKSRAKLGGQNLVIRETNRTSLNSDW